MSKKLIISILLGGLGLYLLERGLIKTELVDPRFEKGPITLKQVVEEAIIDTQGTYGIVIKNLKTGESYSRNEDRIFEAGSLYKLWVLATAYNQIETGNLTEDEILSERVAVLNKKFNIASESAEMTEGAITLTVKSAMQQMITISHNYAAMLLAERVKLSEITNFLKKYKFNNSNVGEPPKTTPQEIAIFLEKLYKGELSSWENTQKMLDFLKGQQLNDGLPKYLPEGLLIAHKTGDIGWFKHDAGIVFSDTGHFIIVVMSESDSPKGGQERIAEISKKVYEYFK